MKKKHWILGLAVMLVGCAKMGQPDGGWFDEQPPRVIKSIPSDEATNVKTKKINIFFNEFIKIENTTEKVVVSPPQLEMPEIVGAGKRIKVELKDSLKPNTTYTIDFSDAISDNSEGNPLGNYTFTFSTGDVIDTLEVSGYVINSSNLEPVKGILVGLYDTTEFKHSTFREKPMLRVSRSDSYGKFIIRGVAPGTYRIFALQDADGDYCFAQKSEMIAFNNDIIVPTCMPDVRQDTLWQDSLHISSIKQVPYTHFLPDDIVLRAFTEVQTDRHFLKSERKDPNRFTLFFSYGSDTLPALRGLNFNERDAFIIEPSEKKDTITYWLRDSLLINQDTLRVEMSYMATDTTGVLVPQKDTLDILPKVSFEKRQKQKNREYEDWKKKQEKAKKRGEKYLETMPAEALKAEWKAPSLMSPDQNIFVELPAPLKSADSTMIHLYSKHDTLWYRAPHLFRQIKNEPRKYELLGEWHPGIEYSLEVDSAAFTDIYGRVSEKFKQGFKVGSLDSYSTLLFTINGMQDTTIVVELLDKNDKAVKKISTKEGKVEFYFVKPEIYYLRMFIDSNGNGLWDTGLYDDNKQAETVYYYPDKIECKAKWDISMSWTPSDKNLQRQKPGALIKQKGEKEKTIKHRNADRARAMGIQYIEGQN